MNKKQHVNEKAFELGNKITGTDRLLIRKKLATTDEVVNKALSGKRKCIRGKSLLVLELAEKLAEINKSKEEIL